MAMGDELLFHTALFACVTHMCYLGKNLHRESAELLQRIVRELNRRIAEAGDSANYSDTTVCAVSCLAMTEVYCNEANRVLVTTNRIRYDEQVAVGSWDKWKLHIEGMKRMLLLKGGMKTIAEGLRMKIYRCVTLSLLGHLTVRQQHLVPTSRVPLNLVCHQSLTHPFQRIRRLSCRRPRVRGRLITPSPPSAPSCQYADSSLKFWRR